MTPRTTFLRAIGVATALTAGLALAACSSSSSNPGGPSSSTTAARNGSSTTPSSGSSCSVTTSSTLPSGQPGKGKPAVVMGDKNFAEEYLLGDLYQQALQAKGFSVTLKGNIGTSTTIDKALTSGKIQMYPEYTGVIYTELAQLGDRPKSAQATYQGAKQWEEKRGFDVLNPTPFQDADGVAVLKTFAQQHGLKTLGDLKKLGSFSFGGPPENRTRYQGVVGMREAYGLTQIKFVPLEIGAQYQALDQHKVDSIAIFTTDGQLASGKYQV